MSGEQFLYNFNVLPIGGYDIILGTKWMSLVSSVIFNFQEEVIVVKWRGRSIVLKDDVQRVKKVITNNSLSQFTSEDAYFLCQVSAVEKEVVECDKIPHEVKELLQQYPEPFAEPKGLPPPRARDHLIPL